MSQSIRNEVGEKFLKDVVEREVAKELSKGLYNYRSAVTLVRQASQVTHKAQRQDRDQGHVN